MPAIDRFFIELDAKPDAVWHLGVWRAKIEWLRNHFAIVRERPNGKDLIRGVGLAAAEVRAAGRPFRWVTGGRTSSCTAPSAIEPRTPSLDSGGTSTPTNANARTTHTHPKPIHYSWGSSIVILSWWNRNPVAVMRTVEGFLPQHRCEPRLML